jgi:hypothetical protein
MLTAETAEGIANTATCCLLLQFWLKQNHHYTVFCQGDELRFLDHHNHLCTTCVIGHKYCLSAFQTQQIFREPQKTKADQNCPTACPSRHTYDERTFHIWPASTRRKKMPFRRIVVARIGRYHRHWDAILLIYPACLTYVNIERVATKPWKRL